MYNNNKFGFNSSFLCPPPKQKAKAKKKKLMKKPDSVKRSNLKRENRQNTVFAYNIHF